MPKKKLPKTVTIELTPLLVNLFARHAKISDVYAKEAEKWTLIQKVSVHGLASDVRKEISDRIVKLFEARFPIEEYMYPAMRAIDEFDEAGNLKPKAKKGKKR